MKKSELVLSIICLCIMAGFCGVTYKLAHGTELTEAECKGASEAESLLAWSDIRHAQDAEPTQTVIYIPQTENAVKMAEPTPTATPTATPTPTETPTPTPTDTPTPTPTPQPARLSQADEIALQKIAWAEAGGEDVQSMAYIIAVVMERVKSPAWADTAKTVIETPGQFTPVRLGTYQSAQPNSKTAAALELYYSGGADVHGATYFGTERSTWHKKHLKHIFTYKKILFYGE